MSGLSGIETNTNIVMGLAGSLDNASESGLSADIMKTIINPDGSATTTVCDSTGLVISTSTTSEGVGTLGGVMEGAGSETRSVTPDSAGLLNVTT